MIKEIKKKADLFKQGISKRRDDYFPRVNTEIADSHEDITEEVQQERSLTHKTVLFWSVGLGFVIIGYLIYNTLDYLYLLIAAYIISLAMEGIISFFTQLTHRRGIGITISYLLLILFLLTGFIIIVPFLIREGTEILHSITGDFQEIQRLIATNGLESYLNSLKRLPNFITNEVIQYVESTDASSVMSTINNNLGNIMNISSSYLKTLSGYAMNTVGRLFVGAGKMLILLTMSVFFSISHFNVKNFLKYFLKTKRNSARKIEEVYGGVAQWLKAQVLLCLVIGIATYFGLRVIDRIGFSIPQKGTLALIAGIFEVLPYLGPRLGCIPAALSALTLFGLPGLIVIIILYVIIQQCEEKFFVPFVMNKTLGVNPLLVLVSMLFGGLLIGFLGVLLAVPLAVILSIVFAIPKKQPS